MAYVRIEKSEERRAEDKKSPPCKKGSMQRRRRSEASFVYGVIALPLLQFIIFYVVVNVNSVALAFKTYDRLSGEYIFSGFNNFKDFFYDVSNESILAICFKNSVTQYLFGLIIIMPLGIVSSFFVYRKIPLAGFFKVILFLPSIISSIVIVLMYRYFIEWVIPPFLMKLGMENTPNFFYDSAYAFKTLLFFGFWSGFGGGIILYTGAMSRIPDSLVEYGQLEGMKMSQEFFRITIPMIWPTITVFLVTGVAGLFTGSVSAYAFYAENASYNVYTLGYYLFVKVIGSNASLADYPYASAAGICFTLIAAPITVFVKYLLEKYGPNPEY